MDTMPFIMFASIAMTCAFVDEQFLPGSIPGGFISTTIVGFLGAWIGSAMLFHIGPDVYGVPVIASMASAAILVFFLSMVTGGRAHTWD